MKLDAPVAATVEIEPAMNDPMAAHLMLTILRVALLNTLEMSLTPNTGGLSCPRPRTQVIWSG